MTMTSSAETAKPRDGEPKVLWRPKDPSNTRMEEFRRTVNKTHALQLETYDDLQKWSCDQLETFWVSVAQFVDLKYSQKWDATLEKKAMDQIPEWFHGMRLNFAENALSRGKADHVALVATGEHGEYRRVTYHELREMVRQCSHALQRAGVAAGDRVAGYIPNCVEAVVAMLAAASIGAIWTSSSPDFGATAVVERFAQTQPKVLVSANAVLYNGKVHDHMAKLAEVAGALPGLELVVVIPFVAERPCNAGGKVLMGNVKTARWDHWLTETPPDAELAFAPLPFNHPLYILYSSGTTGKPKCLVHSAGGTLLQHLKEHIIHGNLDSSDVFFQYTTTGWMMWNWLVSGLALGLTLVLFDGSPFKPDPLFLWRMAAELNVTVFGTSAKYLQSLEEASVRPAESVDLKALHSIYSTGSPLKPESFDYVYAHIKSDLLLGSITGGTDIISLFCGHNAALPVHRGEIQCRCLGMAMEAWDDAGRPVYDAPGDLVCVRPFVSMPVAFYGAEGPQKYHAAYFERYPGVWYHGDFVLISRRTGGVTMLGRSDGTLNPGGVRFGSAELYNVAAAFPQFLDTLVVGQKMGDDERVVMFVQMQPGLALTPELTTELKSRIRAQLSPRHVPALVLEVADIPYTINGKKVEVAVKRIISGEAIVASGQLANPESLDLYRNMDALRL